MNMVMDMPARRAEVSRRIRNSRSTSGVDNQARDKSDGLNLKSRLSMSPEVYTGLQRQPFGE